MPLEAVEVGAGETVPLCYTLRPENLPDRTGGSSFREQTADRMSLDLPLGRKRERGSPGACE